MSSNSEYRFLPLRGVPLPAAVEHRYDRWLAGLEEELADPRTDRDDFCRRVLEAIYFPGGLPREPWVRGSGAPGIERAGGTSDLAPGSRILLDQMDPRNVTLEPEYYIETDLERYYRVKPLIWLWEMFDKSLLGENVHLGVKFRRMLARRIFARCGKNFKAFHFVKFTFGYGIEVGDDVVVHRHVLLDDRGGIRIGNRVSISDYANVYSHSHHISEARDVTTPRTVIGDRVRVAYHATVLAGTTLAANSMVGAGALVTRDTEPDTVHVGIPAKAAKRKPAHGPRPTTRDPLAEV